MYTKVASYTCFEESTKGSIEPGKFADLVLLNADLANIAAGEIEDLEVDMTVIGGEIVYRRNA